MFQSKNLLLSFFMFLFLRLCDSIDTIYPTRSIVDGDVLVSDGGNFALGFFSPKDSSHSYMGIWYNKVSERTVVWVANRDNPITNSSDVDLAVNNTGNLVLRERGGSGPIFWSTDVSVTANGSAKLLDSGNLVLSDDQGVLWQSFDYPTDTYLPRMKFGLDKVTGLNREFVSWVSDANPSVGAYSYKMEFTGLPQVFLYKGTTRVWRTGSWTSRGWSGVPEMTPRFIFNVTYVDDNHETAVVYTIRNSSVFSRLVMNATGRVERLTWHETEQRWVGFWSAPTDQCDSYAYCGPFGLCNPYKPDKFACDCFPGYKPRTQQDWDLRDGSRGCVRARAQTCEPGDGFVELAHVKAPDAAVTARVNVSLGLKECGEWCLGNCSCTGYARDDVSGCITWYESMIDARQFSDGGGSMFVRVDAAELAKHASKTSKKNRFLAIGIPIVATGFIIYVLISCYLAKKRAKSRKSELELNHSNELTSFHDLFMDKDIGENVDLHVFDLQTIVTATDNFSLCNKLGEGGFGSVYKGTLLNGHEIAVKRLSRGSGQGMEEFTNEVTLIAKLQHRNLVRLLGYCFLKEEKMLIYEYLPNKGLDNFIFDSKKGHLLDWKVRFEIIMGIVRGLLYLHQDSRLRIIHRDMKASNVLLDADLHPKISDFGMAKIFGGNQDEAITRRVVGTYGYMSPEYAMEGLFSVKSDVYSFGVLVLEIVSGRKNNSYYLENCLNLVGHIWELWKQDKMLQVVDSSLGDSYDARQILSCIHVGLLCLQESATDRPTMTEVAFMLNNYETRLSSPKQPAFILRNSNYHGTNSTSVSANGSHASVFEDTITIVRPR